MLLYYVNQEINKAYRETLQKLHTLKIHNYREDYMAKYVSPDDKGYTVGWLDVATISFLVWGGYILYVTIVLSSYLSEVSIYTINVFA